MDFETTGLNEKNSRDPLERKAIPGQKNRNLEELLKAYIRLGAFRRLASAKEDACVFLTLCLVSACV